MTDDIVSWGVRTHRFSAARAPYWQARLAADPSVAELIGILQPLPEVAVIRATAASLTELADDALYASLFPPDRPERLHAASAAADDELDEYAHLFPPARG